MSASNSSHDWTPLGDGSVPSEDPGIGLGHIVSVRTYFCVYIALLALTALTVWAAYYEIGGLLTAMFIATIKAGVVTLIFMHLHYESKLVWGIVIYPIFIFLLMVVGTLGDSSIKERPTPSGYEESQEMTKAPVISTEHHEPKAHH